MRYSRNFLHVMIGIALSAVFVACQSGAAGQKDPEKAEETATASPSPTASATASDTPTPTATATPTATLPVVGPEFYAGFNPLTGLPILDESSLQRPALLVAITNWPPTSRPQAGISLGSHVWETSIAQGLSRFLVVYYEDYFDLADAFGDPRELGADPGYILGPVRSGRVAFETIRSMYPGAHIVTRAASYEVLPVLKNLHIIENTDIDDINSAGIFEGELESFTDEALQIDPADYAGLVFDPEPPPGGIDGSTLNIIYNVYTQLGWVYDPESGLYLRLQDQGEGGEELVPLLDRLTGEQLAFENVVVIFARHRFENLRATIMSIDLADNRNRALLFRDGKLYDVFWDAFGRQLHITDKDGIPIPLKSGQTFFEVVSLSSSYDEEARLIRFHSPPLPTLTPTLTPVPTASMTPTASDTPTP